MSTQESQQEIRQLVRSLPARRAPEELRLMLRINASKEASWRRRWSIAPAPFARLREEFELFKANLMRPFAVPAVGGLTAAILVIAMFVQTYPVRANSLAEDIPTSLYTEPSAKAFGPFEPATADAEIEVSIDEMGRVANYRVVSGEAPFADEVRRSVERTLLFTEFTPATSFGQAIPSKLRITLRRGSSSLTVKG
ncbi:MAG: hypothetical protein NW208_07750 [Bryobacter sp.]|nr:hypothetical protein [Bryobacter sp.]